MATVDKAKSSARRAKGNAKEAAEKLTDDNKLRAAGKADQTKGSFKDAHGKLKDAFKE